MKLDADIDALQQLKNHIEGLLENKPFIYTYILKLADQALYTAKE